jgi:hypothetical protein
MPKTTIGLKTCEEYDQINNEPVESCEVLLSLGKLHLFHLEEETVKRKE